MEERDADAFTIGHSTREADELIEALRSHGIELLFDVRTAARSRHVPQANREALASTLPKAGIDYRHVPELGGWRKPLPDSRNSAWRNAAFRGYADYMQTEEFRAALAELIRLSQEKHVAIMCAEAVPYRCHRSLIADALTARGLQVRHIIGVGRSEAHRVPEFARIEAERVMYPGAA